MPSIVALLLSLIATSAPVAETVSVECTVEVDDLPAVLLAGAEYELLVPGHAAVAVPRNGIARVNIDEPSIVRLDGPTYTGAVSIDPVHCGDVVYTLEAVPKPAKLWFVSAIPLSELVVTCVRGCSYHMRTADQFPELTLPEDSPELVVELEFKAIGHRARTYEFKLHPGENQLRVGLQRLEG